MKVRTAYTLLLASSLLLPACDNVLTAPMKLTLKYVCKDDDEACVAAVDQQFDSCHAKYKKYWDDALNSNSSNEDELMEKYNSRVTTCIVDKDGNPYFSFDSQA